VVSNNPSGKSFDEGEDEQILDPHNQNGIICHFVLGGRAVVSPQTILKEKKIDMISKQQGCDKAISLHSPFTQQSDLCCRKERSGAKNSPCLSKTD